MHSAQERASELGHQAQDSLTSAIGGLGKAMAGQAMEDTAGKAHEAYDSATSKAGDVLSDMERASEDVGVRARQGVEAGKAKADEVGARARGAASAAERAKGAAEGAAGRMAERVADDKTPHW